MEDGDTEKYHPSRVIQDFVFLSWKRGCIRCVSLQVYNKDDLSTRINVCHWVAMQFRIVFHCHLVIHYRKDKRR